MAEIGNVTFRVDAVIADEQYHEAMSAVSAANEYIAALEADNARLRVECDEWRRVAKSKQDIIDHMRDARAENAKLRELVKAMTPFLCCMPFASCNTLAASVRKRMSELGIEVDK